MREAQLTDSGDECSTREYTGLTTPREHLSSAYAVKAVRGWASASSSRAETRQCSHLHEEETECKSDTFANGRHGVAVDSPSSIIAPRHEEDDLFENERRANLRSVADDLEYSGAPELPKKGI